jgi:hypothetical protein
MSESELLYNSAVNRESVRLGVKPLEADGLIFFN